MTQTLALMLTLPNCKVWVTCMAGLKRGEGQLVLHCPGQIQVREVRGWMQFIRLLDSAYETKPWGLAAFHERIVGKITQALQRSEARQTCYRRVTALRFCG